MRSKAIRSSFGTPVLSLTADWSSVTNACYKCITFISLFVSLNIVLAPLVRKFDTAETQK